MWRKYEIGSLKQLEFGIGEREEWSHSLISFLPPLILPGQSVACRLIAFSPTSGRPEVMDAAGFGSHSQSSQVPSPQVRAPQTYVLSKMLTNKQRSHFSTVYCPRIYSPKILATTPWYNSSIPQFTLSELASH